MEVRQPGPILRGQLPEAGSPGSVLLRKKSLGLVRGLAFSSMRPKFTRHVHALPLQRVRMPSPSFNHRLANGPP